MNYLHPKYYTFLSKGSGKEPNIHSQCALELLMPEKGQIDYTVYVGAADDVFLKVLDELEYRLIHKDFGFGIYLGQRQFRADIDHVKIHTSEEITFFQTSEYTDTLCIQDNAAPNPADDRNSDIHMIVDQMPVHFQKETLKGKKSKMQQGRMIHSVNRILYEKSGKRIFGRFENAYQISSDKIITFYEG